MKFSILIANYNTCEYISDAVLSALNQNFAPLDFEIVVCDDCSTDNSLEVLNGFNGIRLLKNEVNYGIGFTRNKLIDNSHGDYFLFLDSDDILKSNCLTEFDKIIQYNNQFSLLYAQSDYIGSDGVPRDWKRSKKIQQNLLFETFNYPIFHPILYSRFCYNLTEGISILYRCAEDYDLWYKMEEVGDILFVDKVLYTVRLRENSLTFSNNKDIKWMQNFLYQYHVSMNAYERRKLNVDDFVCNVASIIFERLKTKNKTSFLKRVLNKIFFIF